MEVGITASWRVPSHESQVWHGCLHGNTFGSEAWDLYPEVGRAKAKPNCQHKLHNWFCIKQSRNECDEPYFNCFMTLKNWNFASMLGLANVSGTWDPMWSGPYNILETSRPSLACWAQSLCSNKALTLSCLKLWTKVGTRVWICDAFYPCKIINPTSNMPIVVP